MGRKKRRVKEREKERERKRRGRETEYERVKDDEKRPYFTYFGMTIAHLGS